MSPHVTPSTTCWLCRAWNEVFTAETLRHSTHGNESNENTVASNPTHTEALTPPPQLQARPKPSARAANAPPPAPSPSAAARSILVAFVRRYSTPFKIGVYRHQRSVGWSVHSITSSHACRKPSYPKRATTTMIYAHLATCVPKSHAPRTVQL